MSFPAGYEFNPAPYGDAGQDTDEGSHLSAVPTTDEPGSEGGTYGEPDTLTEPSTDTPAGNEGPDEPDDAEAGDRRARKASNRPLIRRVAVKATEVAQARVEHRHLLSALLGCESDVASLTTAIMTASRGATSAVSDVRDLIGKTGAETGITVMSMGRSRMKQVWAVLVSIGAAQGNLPPADTKAALAIAGALGGIDAVDSVSGDLDAVIELGKRGW